MVYDFDSDETEGRHTVLGYSSVHVDTLNRPTRIQPNVVLLANSIEQVLPKKPTAIHPDLEFSTFYGT